MLRSLIRQIGIHRRQMDHDLRFSPRRAYSSAILLGQYRVTVPLIQRYARGALIDLGCGVMSYRHLIAPHVARYDGVDAHPQTPDVTFTGDVQDLSMISDQVYDSAVCLEVLEHVPDPGRVLSEAYRVLKSGGVLIISAPHLSRQHELPNDYYRYTPQGLRALLERAQFEVIQISRRGGLGSFLSHQVSLALLGLTWSVPVLGSLAWLVNEWLCVRPAYAVDQWTDRQGLFAAGFTAVARKP